MIKDTYFQDSKYPYTVIILNFSLTYTGTDKRIIQIGPPEVCAWGVPPGLILYCVRSCIYVEWAQSRSCLMFLKQKCTFI